MGNQKIISSGNKCVNLWDINTGQLLHTLDGHTSYITSVTISIDNLKIACIYIYFCRTASADNSIKIWDANTGQLLDTINEYIKGTKCMAFSKSLDDPIDKKLKKYITSNFQYY